MYCNLIYLFTCLFISWCYYSPSSPFTAYVVNLFYILVKYFSGIYT